jgi:hypothetical protein
MRRFFLVLILIAASSAFVSAQSNAVPFLNQPLIPSAVPAGGPAFTLTLNGSGFVPGSVVTWNGSALNTTFASATQLTAFIPAGNILDSTTARIIVTSPGPGGGDSSPAFFTVTNPTASVAFKVLTLNQVPSAIAVAAADFNNDGKADLAVVSQETAPSCNYHFGSSGSIFILLSNGDGTFTQATALCLPDFSIAAPYPFVLAEDINGDGHVDLITKTIGASPNHIVVYFGAGDGTFSSPAGVFEYDGGCCANLAFGDFSGQGQVQMAISYLNTFAVSFLKIGGDFVYVSGNGRPLRTGPLAAGDFNRDGKLDLAWLWGGLSVYLNDANGRFTKVPGQSNVGSSGVSVGDFNGDGILDLISDNGILLGKGDGTFTLKRGSPGPGVVADFNGDGKLDLAVGNSVYLGNGDGTFHPGINLAASTETAGDFNGDGRIDLAGVNSDGTVSVLLQTKIPTSVSLTSSLSASTFGQPITLTATMTPHGFGSPTGSILFEDGGSILGTANLSSGIASLTISSLSAGTHSVVASYPGDSNFLASISLPLTQLVNPGMTQCRINATPVYIHKELKYRLTASVTPVPPAAGLPSGNVGFWDSAYSEVLLGHASLVDDKASVTVSLDPEPNPQWVKSMYAGDANFKGCESPYFAIFQ